MIVQVIVKWYNLHYLVVLGHQYLPEAQRVLCLPVVLVALRCPWDPVDLIHLCMGVPVHEVHYSTTILVLIVYGQDFIF